MNIKKLLLILSVFLAIPGISSAGELSEKEKINMLIKTISQAEAVFIRNGKQHSVTEASEHIRKKYEYAGNKIKTARQFIDMLASQSYFSGKPYYVRFNNGHMKTTRYWLQLQLHRFEESFDSASIEAAAHQS